MASDTRGPAGGETDDTKLGSEPDPAQPTPGAKFTVTDIRRLWPEVLEEVKGKRRFTWILLSQNAQVTGFDGTTLQLGFVNVGARDNFASSGSEDVLRQALSEQFNVQWKIDAIVDPSGGGSAPSGGGFNGGGYGGGGAAGPAGAPGGHGGGTAGGYGAAPAGSYGGAAAATSPRPAPSPSAGPATPSGSTATAARATAPAPAPPSAPEPAPAPVAPEDDTPEDDDPDLDESALSGQELIVRELGATVVEEFTNE